MSVVNDTITNDKEEIIDNISQIDNVVSDKLAELKAKMAEKKKLEAEMPAKIVEKRKRSLNFGVVGSGHAGARLGEALYNLGYTAVAFNNAPQDLEQIKIPEANKYLLEYGIGGAAKDMDIGYAAANAHRDGITNVIQDTLADSDVFLFCTSLGGGSGAGSAEVIIDILSRTGKPIIVITVLPLSTEDVQTKNNALQTLAKL